MTVSSQECRTSAVGSGAVGQEVAFTFPIVATTDLWVISRVTATGVETTLVETTNYTVTIDGNSGGIVTTVTAVAATSEIHVIRNTPMTQTLDLEDGGDFSAPNVEGAFDKATRLIVEDADAITRCLRAPGTDPTTLDMELPNAVDRASCYLTFDASGNPTATSTLSTGTATISAFGRTIIDDANAAAVFTTLGISAYAQTLLDDASASATRTTLGVVALSDILSLGGDVLCWEDEIITWNA